MNHPTQRPWRISYKVSDAIICIGEAEKNGDYYGGKLICESVEPSNADLIVKAVNSYDDLLGIVKSIANGKYCEGEEAEMCQKILLKLGVVK